MAGCCLRRIDGVEPGSGGAQSLEVRGFELDFTNQGTRAFATGNENVTITPVGSTTLSSTTLALTTLVAVGDTLTMTAGSGLIWDEGTTNTTWTTTTRSATSILSPLSQLHTLLDIDSTWTLRLDVYFSAISLLNAEFLVCGLDGVSGTPANAGDRLSGGGRARQAATQVWRPAIQATGVNYTTAPGGTLDVSGIIVSSHAIIATGGTWSGSFDSLRLPVQWGVGKLQDAGLSAPMLDQNTRMLFNAFASNGVVGTSSATLERLRVEASSLALAA